MERKSAVVFLSLCLVVGVSGFQATLQRHESQRSQLKREHGLEGLRMWHEQQQLGVMDGEQDLNMYGSQFTVSLGIGKSPTQWFKNVLIDFNSQYFWVVDSACATDHCPAYCKKSAFCDLICEAGCCPEDTMLGAAGLASSVSPPSNDSTICPPADRLFNSSQSSTYQEDDRVLSEDQGGQNVTGLYGSDYVVLGKDSAKGFVINRITFGQATILAGRFASGKFDGKFGLMSGANVDGVESVIEKASHIESTHFYVTAWLPQNRSIKEQGKLIWNEYYSKCFPLTPFEKIPRKPGNAWVMDVEGAAVSFDPKSSGKTPRNFTASLDIQQEHVSVPSTIFDEIVNGTAARYNAKYGHYFVDCNTYLNVRLQISRSSRNLPAVELNLTPDMLIEKLERSVCILNIVPSNNTRFVLGEPIFRKFCVHVDALGHTIAIGKRFDT